jgi:hypothetical protein
VEAGDQLQMYGDIGGQHSVFFSSMFYEDARKPMGLFQTSNFWYDPYSSAAHPSQTRRIVAALAAYQFLARIE